MSPSKIRNKIINSTQLNHVVFMAAFRMEFETVDMDTDNIEVNFTKSDYAQVLFHNIAETYPIDAHIECRYTITPALTPTTRDWIGLYRVGWRSSSDHVFFEWSPMPENHQPGSQSNNHILFQCKNILYV